MHAFTAVPSGQAAMLPASSINAIQLCLRLHLSLLSGISTCVCGAPVDPYGDHLLSCSHLLCHRTPGHDLIMNIVGRMAKRAGHVVSYDCRRPRPISRTYSPNYCPDITLLHGSETGSHVLVDVTVPSVVKQSAMPAAACMARAVSSAAEAGKRHSYGAVAPHVVLPFVVEHAGALGKDADKFFHAIVKKVRNELNASEEAESSWSSRGFSNFYYQRISVANLKGLGHFFLVAEALLRSAGNVPFGS